jgi:hypothetical protein
MHNLLPLFEGLVLVQILPTQEKHTAIFEFDKVVRAFILELFDLKCPFRVELLDSQQVLSLQFLYENFRVLSLATPSSGRVEENQRRDGEPEE